MGSQVRYSTVLAHPEFRALFAAQALSFLGDQLARIALAILVFHRTGSPFEASATYGVSYLCYLVGGPLLAGLSDRYPRLTVMVTCDLVRAPLVLILCLRDPPISSVFTVIVALGVLAPPFDAARGALQPDVLAGDDYVVSQALMNLVMELSQVLGFVLGGAVVALTSVRGALAVDAATFLVSAGLLLHGVRHRGAALAADERRSFLHDTAEGIRLVIGRPDLRSLLAMSVIGTAGLIGTEGLAVPVAHALHGGTSLAGVLTATSPAGFMIGSVAVLRVDPARRIRLMAPLVVLGAVPLLATPFVANAPTVVLLWLVSGAGATVNLIAAPAFTQRCPRDVRARALGVASTALLSSQGLGLLLAGALGGVFGARAGVALLALATLALAVPLLSAQGTRQTVRDLK